MLGSLDINNKNVMNILENVHTSNKGGTKSDDIKKTCKYVQYETLINKQNLESIQGCDYKCINKIITDLSIRDTDFPEEVKISTMTFICKVATEFNVTNIGKYLDVSYGKIHSINFGDMPDTNTAIIKIKKKKKKKKQKQVQENDENKKENKKKKDHFFNQVSVTSKSPNGKLINIKLFLNGTIQITGCKNYIHTMEALQCLFNELKKTIYIYNTKKGKFIEKKFVKDEDELFVSKISKPKIVMINTNFDIGYTVNRDKLFEYTQQHDIIASYDPNVHAGVNIKYKIKKKKISIFVFESGSIIITGASNSEHVKSAYEFINKLLLANYDKFVTRDVLSESLIDLILQ